MKQTYTKEFQCEYQLARYPFDIQTCAIMMNVKLLDNDTVTLVPDQIVMNENTLLTMYIINDWKLAHRNINIKEMGIKMEILLKRRIMNELMTTYAPNSFAKLIIS